MKYMLMMNAPGKVAYQIDDLAEAGHPGAHRLHGEFREEAAGHRASGSTGRVWPVRIRRSWCGPAQDGRPITDGVFPESKEFLAGFWIVEVPSAARAYEIAAEASAAPGPGGAPFNMPIEVREVQCGPPPSSRTESGPERG